MPYTFNQFEQKMQQISSITLLEFSGVKNPIKWKCNTCGTIYSRKQADGILKRKTLCQKCHHVSNDDRIKKIERFQQRAEQLGYDITILSYNGECYPLTYKCNKCDSVYTIEYARNIFDPRRKGICCKKCYNELLFQEKINSLKEECCSHELDFISISNKRNVKLLCKNCGEIFTRDIYRLKNNYSCPYCGGKKVSYRQFLNRLSAIHSDDFIILNAEDYKSLHINSILVKHKCGFCYKTSASNLLKNNCPKCSKKDSRGERQLMRIFDNNQISYIYQYKVQIDNRYYYFDFFLPDINTMIEYDGAQHYMPVEYFGGEQQFAKQKNIDNLKNDWCKNNNIQLIRISYSQDIKKVLESSTTILNGVDSSESKR